MVITAPMNTSDNSLLIFLSSRANRNTESYDAVYSLNVPRLNHMQAYGLSLQNIEFPNVVYPINEYNNQFSFSESGGATITTTLTSNSYTGTQFVAALAAQMTAVSVAVRTYTGSYDSQTKKATITVGAGTFRFMPNASTALSLYESLGMDESLLTTRTTAASQTSEYPINVSGSSYVDVVTNLSTLNYSLDTTANVLVRIPLINAFGSMVFYEPSTDDRLAVDGQNLTELEVRLRDDHGNPWKLPSTAHLSITLKVTPEQ